MSDCVMVEVYADGSFHDADVDIETVRRRSGRVHLMSPVVYLETAEGASDYLAQEIGYEMAKARGWIQWTVVTAPSKPGAYFG